MADFPVFQPTPYDATAPLHTLSSLLDIKRSQQALQTGQYIQESAAAQAQQEQQTAGQRAQLGQFFKNYDISQHSGPDGTLDLNSLSDPGLRAAAGDAYPAVADALLKIKSSQLQAKQTLANLNDNLRGQFTKTVSGLASDPDVVKDNPSGRDKVKGAIDAFGASGGPDAQRVADTYGPIVQHAPPGKLAIGLQNLRLQAIDATSQQAAMAPGTVTNAAGQIVKREPIYGALSPSPVAGASPTTGAPGAAPTATPSGGINPTASEVAGATARQVQTGNADIDRANEVGALQQQSAAAIPLTQRIDQLSHDINSGKVAKMISETGNYFGISSINEARSQLNKDLGQVKALAIARSGSDARAATVLEGYPTDTTPEETTHAAMDYIRGTARQNLARGQVLSQYQKQDPQGLRGFQAADNVMTATVDPLMHEYQALSPSERAGFYRRNFSTAEEAQAFKDHVNALKKHTQVFGQ